MLKRTVVFLNFLSMDITMLKSSLMSFFALLYITGTALAGPAEPVVVFAGSASQPPLEAAAEIFQAKTGIPVTLYLGGSGSMLNQIRLTGQGDLYIPGSPDFMDKARDFGLVDAESIPSPIWCQPSSSPRVIHCTSMDYRICNDRDSVSGLLTRTGSALAYMRWRSLKRMVW